MVTVKIEEELLLNMLLDRVLFWNQGKTDYSYRLYEDYFSNLLDSGWFDGAEFDVQDIVDNCWVNDLKTYQSKQDAIDDYGEYWDDDKIVTECDGAVLVSCR